MRRIIGLLVLFLLISMSIFANVSDYSTNGNLKGIKLSKERSGMPSNSREYPVPEFEVSVAPTGIVTSFYDYMPGSYDGYPARVRMVDGEMKHIYFTFHAQASATAERYIYYAYIDEDGNMTYDRVSGNSYREGFPGIQLDPVTGDPLVTYHDDDNDDGVFDVVFTYDLNHFIGGAGYWSDPVKVIDNSNNPAANHTDDQFCWPYTYVSSSPAGDDYRRVYIFAKNFANHYENANDDNPIYAYADFTTADLESLTPLNWTVQTLPALDAYVMEDGLRPYFVTNVTENGEIYIWGYFHPNDELIPDAEPETFIYYNDNFGEIDDWEEILWNSEKYVDPPLDQDGSNTLLENPYFTNYFASNLGTVIDNEGKLHWITSYALMGNSLDTGEGVYIQHRIYMKKGSWDPVTREVGYADLYPKGVNPYDENPYLPWDEDENGEVDYFSDEGEAITLMSWPIFYHTCSVDSWSDDNLKMSYNPDTGWMAAVWQDGLKNAYAQEFDDEDYVEWTGVPEIYIAMSYDHGETWTDPLTINANETPELAGMTPEYIYPADRLIELDEETERLYLFFLNDNDFGSFIQYNTLPNTGGVVSYMAVDIGLAHDNEDETEDIPQVVKAEINSYPNPFNNNSDRKSGLTIQYNLPKASFGNIAIYNVKGQLIKTVYEGKLKESDTVTWNGLDNNNNEVTSGIYFYKLEAEGYTATNKLIYMK